MTAVRRRLRAPVPWRVRVVRAYPLLVNVSITGLVGAGWASAGLSGAGRPGSAWVALWLSVLAAAVLLKVLLAVGPVFAGADRLFWVFSSPVPRGELLRPRLAWLLAGGAAAGAVWPAVVSGVVGTVLPPFVAVGIGAAAGVAVVAVAVVLQRVRVRPQRWLSVLAGVAVPALFMPPDWDVREPASGVVAVAWAVAITLAGVALESVRHLRRFDLAAGAVLAGVARVSVSWFDLALLGAILAERRARALGRVKSARLRGSRLVVLVWSDVLRLRRSPNALLVWAALLPVPGLVALGGEVEVVAAVHLVAAFLATDRLAAGLKSVCRSPALRRALGLPDRTLRLAHLAFPAAGAVLWCAVTTAITPHVTVLNGVVSAVGAVAAVYRIATRPPVDYGAAIVSVGFYGPAPLGLVVQLSRGPALLAVLAVAQTAL